MSSGSSAMPEPVDLERLREFSDGSDEGVRTLAALLLDELEEAARAHNIIWSMRRFRHRSGDTVGRKIERMRTLVEKHGASPVIEAAARQIPTRLRASAFGVAADLVLVDGRMERLEGRFLRRLAVDLGLERHTAKSILDVMRLKNSA